MSAAVPTDLRDDEGIAERRREFAREDAAVAALVLKDGELAMLEQQLDVTLDVPLDRLHLLRDRIERQQLEPDDRALLSAMIGEVLGRMERM
jgi:hypothetical protein